MTIKHILAVLAIATLLASCHKEKINPDDDIKMIGYKLHADSSFTFYIPTGFTPNGDFINDYWEPVSNPVAIDSSNYLINILSKRGEILFSSTTPAKFYGIGKNGKVLAQQTLCYYVEIQDKKQKEKYTFRGNFTLFR